MRNAYSISEFIKTAYSLLITKVTISQARLIRRPVYIRGGKSLCGCKGLTTGRFCRFDLKGDVKRLFIGDNCEFGDLTHIVAYDKVTIGNNVLIASKVFVSDVNHGNYRKMGKVLQDAPYTSPNDRQLITNPTSIGNNVWIGENVVILPGSKIGDGCIIGANSVVSGVIDEKSIAVGVPARVIKKWCDKKNQWEVVR